MTIIIEIGKPFQAKPGKLDNSIIVRRWWLFFAVSKLKVPFREFCETPFKWSN